MRGKWTGGGLVGAGWQGKLAYHPHLQMICPYKSWGGVEEEPIQVMVWLENNWGI